MTSTSFKYLFPGIVFSLAVGLIAIWLSSVFSTFNSILTGLFGGIILGNLISFSEIFKPGISWVASKFLEWAVVFLAFGISFATFNTIGVAPFIGLVVLVALMVWITYFFAKKMKCPGAVGWMVGFGTAICGSSAIAALAPTLKKSPEDVGVSLAVVNLYGTLGMIILPVFMLAWGVSDEKIAFMIGGSLHSVGNVAGAAFAVGDVVGENALLVKMIRVALLTPGLIWFNYLLNKGASKSWKSYIKLPWYLWVFMLLTAFQSAIEIPSEIVKFFQELGKYTLTFAMTAIGLNIVFKKLIQSGKRGLVFGAMIFGIQLLLLIIIWGILGMKF